MQCLQRRRPCALESRLNCLRWAESKWAEEIVGKIHVRPEAVAKVTGRALFTDDMKIVDMVYGRAKRADIPHAIVKSLDVSKAKTLPGVLAVLTAEDIPGEHYHGDDHPRLAEHRWRW